MFAELSEKFAESEIAPVSGDIEAMAPGLMPSLLRKAGELGLLSPDIAQEWGGMGLDIRSSMLITEGLCGNGSFIASHTDHTAFGTLPIAWFGSDEQKARYLPALATGDKLAAFALTEPGSGSDARGALTKATLSADGRSYLVSGSKQFITNSGFADIIVTFAKVDGRLTAFLVDTDSPGVALGNEEKKTGIWGSSTRSVTYDEVKVPVENLLLEVGQGHVVAFNVLNAGRLKLAAQCVGTAKTALKYALQYGRERHQFGKPIARFGLVQEKFARLGGLVYVSESMLYRACGRIDETLAGFAAEGFDRAVAIGLHAAECSINKVFASESLDAVADETVQIFGGNGYIRDYPADQLFRDARINRIFAGTNEINRLLIARALVRGVQDLDRDYQPAQIDAYGHDDSDPTVREACAVAVARRALLVVARMAIDKHGAALDSEQEVLGLLADLAIQIYALESALLRSCQAVQAQGVEQAAAKLDLLRCYFSDAAPALYRLIVEALAAVAPAHEFELQLHAVAGLLRCVGLNTIPVRRRIAIRLEEAGRYVVA